MTISRKFAIALLGCTMLSGCNKDHYQADNAQGTFTATATDTASSGQTPPATPGDNTPTTNPPDTTTTTTTTTVVLLTGPSTPDIDKLIADATALQATSGLSDATRQGLATLLSDANTLKTAYGTDPTADITPQLDTLSTDLAALSANADISGQLAGLTEDVDYLRPRADVPLTQYVNLFVGTQMSDTGSGYSGDDTPNAQTPLGMASLGPDTRGSGVGYGAGSGGYDYGDTTIQFFSMTHMNGPGCRGQGAVAMLPANTAAQSLSAGVGYSHSDESAEPGYYKVKFGNGITTELTATTRTGMMRVTYADPANAYFILNARLNNGNKSGGVNPDWVNATIGDDRKSLSGNAVASAFCDGTWAQPVYFYATFDKPLKTSSVSTPGLATLQFDLSGGDNTAQIRVGISSVSVKNAQLNLDTENSKLAFDDIRKQTSDIWNHRLNAVQLDLGKPGEVARLATASQPTANDNLTKFYTAMYRLFSGPTVFSDVNGDYRSMDGNPSDSTSSLPVRKTENVKSYPFKVDGNDAQYTTHYSSFSTWDTYRSQSQLLALLAPDEASDMMQSLVADAQQCGALPHWVDGSEDTTPMEGSHTPNVIAGSYAFGARKFDTDKASTFIINAATDPTSMCNNKYSFGRNNTGQGLPQYLKLGYVPVDSDATQWHSTSVTEEMINSDRSSAAFLSSLPTASVNAQTIAALFKRSTNWLHIFDTTAKKLVAKYEDGTVTSASFQEGTEPQYIWEFAYDWTSLIGQIGGKAAAITRLNTLFGLDKTKPLDPTKEPSGQTLNSGEGGSTYYIGNEPSFPTPWAYNWAGAPQNAQYILPVIMRKNFGVTPTAFPGNDDLGATSSWYILASLGLFPVIPSEPGLAVSTPQFSGATVWLGNGSKLRISTDKQAMLDDVRYINEMKLNDAVYQGSWLPLAKIANGGRLSYTLSPTPTTWGTDPALTPPSGPNADYSQPTATPPAGTVQLIK